MGLDMYLTAENYLSRYDETDRQRAQAIADICFPANNHERRVQGVIISCAYWRKANQIHQWFVNNCQNGEDNCRKYSVDRDELRDLVSTCRQILDNKNKDDVEELIEELLPPQDGFFFGSTDIDEYYFEDLRNTVNQLEPLLDDPQLGDFEFYYQSSW